MTKVRVGVIGCGGFTRYRLSKLLEIQEAEVVALADPSEDQIRQTKERYPRLEKTPTYSSHKRMMEEVELDAVTIATPHALHFEEIMDSFAKGLHVICEKPLVATVEQAHKVIAERDRVKKVGMVSYQRHFQPEFRFIREKIRSGEAGKVQFVQALLGQEWKMFTTGSWRQDPALSCGGMLNDSGSHMLDILLWTSGLTVQSVSALYDNRQTPVEINASLAVKFREGALGNIAVVGDAQQWYEDITFWCENETFYLRQGKLSWIDRAGNRHIAEHLVEAGSSDRNFIEAILGRAECECPFESALRVVELTEAAVKSSERGGAAVEVE